MRLHSTPARPNPPLSLAGEPSDLHIIEAALKRLIGFARHLATDDLSDPVARCRYHMMRARANAVDALRRAAK